MELYNEIEPYNKGLLKVSDIHSIYYEESGNPTGQPILFVHGGPGGGTSASNRQFFDPQHYRIILFDQRGCGQSIPSACIEQNTTLDLVSDMEALRKHLNIDKWILFGGSWGSTLSLVYAINHPEHVKAMILRGIFLGRKEDDDWLYQAGASYYFPIEYAEYVNFIPEEERHDLINAYHKYLNSEDTELAERAAYHWAKWELGLITLNKIPILEELLENTKSNLELARLENHYFVNHIFLEENYILKNVEKIANIKTIIIHGQYDMDCRPVGAYLLHQALNNSSLRLIPESGHSAREKGISSALLEATEEFKSL
ncbi:prolyl aminopeptidase [Metamycoplasma neophronis]|uniref:Proline iminopeptidase n=1 Tax=Metamycoplasma neophronis TaxID=872983 RepID=A0ABY2Z1K0_9BACT|nr:prolyl aminopeptidase [Metamycoplasma neophronis]TPR54697.1 prolyl aminopeptidase [Metamycoplasma neophronis]